jgi:hypothetical protein
MDLPASREQQTKVTMKNYCFIHYSIIGNGEKSHEIFVDLIKRIRSTDLKLEEILVVTNGNKSQLKTKFEEFKVRHLTHEDDRLSWEFPALVEIQEFSKNSEEDHRILYLHLKGVSSGDHKNVKESMCKAVIDRYQECIDYLEEYDACGYLFSVYSYRGSLGPHFSGNFWWSKVSHIQQLPDPRPDSIYKSHFHLIDGRINKNHSAPMDQKNAIRYLAEFWIGMKQDGKYKDIIV